MINERKLIKLKNKETVFKFDRYIRRKVKLSGVYME